MRHYFFYQAIFPKSGHRTKCLILLSLPFWLNMYHLSKKCIALAFIIFMSIVSSNAQTTFTTERVVDNMGTIKKVLKGWSTASGNTSDIFNTDLGNVGIGTTMPKATLHNAGSTIFGTKSVTAKDLSANTTLSYSDILGYTVFNYSASVSGLTLTLPFLMTDATAGRIITIVNTGSANSFTVSGVTLPAGYAQAFVWNGAGWSAQSSPVAISVPISGFTASTKINNVDNLNYAQTWNWNSLADNVGLTLASNSTAATAANTQTLLDVKLSGTNATAGVTTYGATIANKHGYTTSGTNVGLLVSASGGTTNYGVLVPNGNVGIGTTSPAQTLTVNGNIGLSDGTYYTSFMQGTQAGNIKYTLPTTVPTTSGQVLSSTTDGILSWSSANPGGGITIGTINGQTKSATNGAVINANTLYLQSADASNPGLVTTGLQTFTGQKIFSNSTTVFGSGEGGIPTATYLRGPQAGGTGTPGANLYIQASNGTGAGGSGNIIFQTGSASTINIPSVSAVDNRAFGNANTYSFSNYAVPSSGSNQLLMVLVNLGYNGVAVSSVTYGTSSLSQLGNITSATNRMEVWYLVAPSVGTNATITVNLNNYATSGVTAMTWSNVNQTTPFGPVSSSNNQNGSSSILTPSSSLGQVVMDFITTTTSPITAMSSQTIIGSVHNGISAYGTCGYKLGSSGSTTVGYSFSASNFGYMAFAIQSVTNGSANAFGDAFTITNTGNTQLASHKFLKFTDSSSNTVGITAPSSVTTSYSLTLPSTQGDANTFLKNDGSGGLSWGSVSIPTISASSPLNYSNGAISMNQASSSATGYLSSTDWNIFSNKISGTFSGLAIGDILKYDGVTWVNSTPAATLWTLNGNTNATMKTLGTTDAYDLPFITNNTERMRISSSGKVGIGVTSPSALLNLGAGTAAAAPLKFSAGTNLNTTEAGTMEYNGSHLYFTATSGGTRYQLEQQEVTNTLLTDVTMTTAGIWYPGTSVLLTPGTWLINAQITMGKAAATADIMYTRIYNSTSSIALASGQAHNPNTNPHATTITLSTVVTLTTPATISVDGTSSVANGLIKAKLMANGQGNNATMITAVQIR